MHFYLHALLFLLLLSGCSHKKIDSPLYDIIDLPQDISFFTKDLHKDSLNSDSNFKDNYYRVWDSNKHIAGAEHMWWAFETFTSKDTYAQNLQPYTDLFFSEMNRLSNIDNALKLKQKAISLRHLNLRAFPTNKPLFRDPTKAGEGFPFDYLQNSTIYPQTPLLLSHYSTDSEWVYVFSSFASGWVKSQDILIITDTQANSIRKLDLLFVTQENYSAIDKSGEFIFRSRIGMVLPLVKESKESFVVRIASAHRRAFIEIEIPKTIASATQLNLTSKEDLNLIINQLLGSPYGWGGAYGERDCSSVLRDLFTPFGIYLPRNSAQQSRVGEVIELEALDINQKKELIKRRAAPFKTLLYQQGHILLYVGEFQGEVVALHNIWGIRVIEGDQESRVLIGKTILSTLNLGERVDNFDQNSMMIKRLKSMNTLKSR